MVRERNTCPPHSAFCPVRPPSVPPGLRNREPSPVPRTERCGRRSACVRFKHLTQFLGWNADAGVRNSKRKAGRYGRVRIPGATRKATSPDSVNLIALPPINQDFAAAVSVADQVAVTFGASSPKKKHQAPFFTRPPPPLSHFFQGPLHREVGPFHSAARLQP